MKWERFGNGLVGTAGLLAHKKMLEAAEGRNFKCPNLSPKGVV